MKAKWSIILAASLLAGAVAPAEAGAKGNAIQAESGNQLKRVQTPGREISSSINHKWNKLGFNTPPPELRGHWSEELFQWAIAVGIVTNLTGADYRPDESITELEFLVFFYRSVNVGTMLEGDMVYNLARAYSHPVKGVSHLAARNYPITRFQAAEFVAGAQGVNFKKDAAVQYLLSHGLTGNRLGRTLIEFNGEEKLTRAETLHWIRQLLLNGRSIMVDMPKELSDTSQIPPIPAEGEPLPDFKYEPISRNDLSLVISDGNRLPIGSSRSEIEKRIGKPLHNRKDLFGLFSYADGLKIGYDHRGQMTDWVIGVSPSDAPQNATTTKGIALNSTLQDVLMKYGSGGYSIDGMVQYFFEIKRDRLSRLPNFIEADNPAQTYELMINMDKSSAKVSMIAVISYRSFWPENEF